jgi:hypothetical protein
MIRQDENLKVRLERVARENVAQDENLKVRLEREARENVAA